MDFRLYIWPRKSRHRIHPEQLPRCSLEWADQKISLSPDQAAVIGVLSKGALVSTNDLIDVVYGDREDGGPLHATRVIYVKICHLRKKLADTPFRIITNGCAGYRLITTMLDGIAKEVLDE
jgi:DNA-binding response OmpR family regulator